MKQTETATAQSAEQSNAVDGLVDTLERLGGELYGGEEVSQVTHALQCAALAMKEGAAESLVVAALLHDLGHLVNPKDAGAAAKGIDAAHERVGAAYLSRWFGPEVTVPIALHVAAKRYLCTVEEGYFERLSAASVQSLSVQGGPYTPAEAEVFMAQPFAAEAVALRRWDEAAKDPEMATPALESFRPMIERVIAAKA